MSRRYEIEIKTGNRDNAGTDADVYVQLIGGMGISGENYLDRPGVDDFERGHTDVFYITDKDVGWINQIRLFHNNKGRYPGWYVDYVKVRYPDVGLEFEAPFYRWLAKDEGDKKIDVTHDVIVQTPTYAAGYLERTYLGYQTRRKSNDGPTIFHYGDEFTFNHIEGLSLALGNSKTVSKKVSLSGTFFGVGSSFEYTVTSSATRQFNTSVSESFTTKATFDTELQPGQAVTVVAVSFQDIFTAEATTGGVVVPLEQRFAVTVDLYTFSGVLSDAQVQQKVVDILKKIGAPAQPHVSGQAMRLPVARKPVPAPLNAASVAAVRDSLRVQTTPGVVAIVPGASPLPGRLMTARQR